MSDGTKNIDTNTTAAHGDTGRETVVKTGETGTGAPETDAGTGTKSKVKGKAKSKKISPLRILMGLCIGILLVFALLGVDDHLANLPFYNDFAPSWSPDGKNVIYCRWYPYKYDFFNSFEVWKMDAETSQSTMIYHSRDGFTAFGVRRLRISDDGRYVNLRLNKKIIETGEIKDLLVRVPMEGKEPVVEWELEKLNAYDVFLAYKDDRVILRRVQEGANFSKVLEYRFSDRSQVREVPVPPDTILSMIDFYGAENRLFGILISGKPNSPEIVNTWLYDVDSRQAYTIDRVPVSCSWLKNRNSVLVHDTLGVPPSQFLREVALKKVNYRNVQHPYLHSTSFDFAVLADETHVLMSNGLSAALLDLNTFKSKPVLLPVTDFRNFDLNRKTGEFVFRNMGTIQTFNLETGKHRVLTQMSPRSKYYKKWWYLQYMNLRERILTGDHGDHAHEMQHP